MKRVLLAALTLVAAGLMAGPSAAQAVVHHTTGTIDFGASGTPCVAKFAYEGTLPGTGTIESVELPSGCTFYGTSVSVPMIYLDASFNTDGTVDLVGDFTVSYALGSWWCDYTTEQEGSWNSGSPTAFLTDGALVRQNFTPLCNFPAMNNLVISAVFLD